MYSSQQLSEKFLNQADTNPAMAMYAAKKFNKNGQYLGWVGIDRDGQKPPLYLNLENEKDVFLLFCLASAWSASGPWENAATIVYTMKYNVAESQDFEAWIQSDTAHYIENQIRTLIQEANHSVFKPRKKVAIRIDMFPAFRNIARNWPRLVSALHSADRASDWKLAINEIREIEDLAPAGRKLLIKIPLILRELRCQKVFSTIPGEFCCIPDGRVLQSLDKLDQSNIPKQDRIPEYRPSNTESLVRVSEKIYIGFGDLYDLPLFALPDLI